MMEMEIVAGLEFSGDSDAALTALLRLPAKLRPTYFSGGERLRSKKNAIDDKERFAEFQAQNKLGYFLIGKNLKYHILITPGKPDKCYCYLSVSRDSAFQFMLHMSNEDLYFGYACLPEERMHRNRVFLRLGRDMLESWVGRDSRRYVPGFYWLTFVSSELIRHHRLRLHELRSVARRHYEIGGGGCLIEFYERPEDWTATELVDKLCATIPTVFNAQSVREKLVGVDSLDQAMSILRETP